MLTTEQVLAEIERRKLNNIHNPLSAVPSKENKFRHPLENVKKKMAISQQAVKIHNTH